MGSFGRQRIEIPVRIESSSNSESNSLSAFDPPPVSFVRDVLPALSKAGCNAGSCHAKAEGQNGFKLSVFSYDPKSDYRQIVKGDRKSTRLNSSHTVISYAVFCLKKKKKKKYKNRT